MVSQAHQVLEKTFEAAGFKGSWIKGTLHDGGAIFLNAQKMFPNCVWNSVYQQIDFNDQSCIEYIAHANSMFEVTYKAVW
jgi:hypothetical protein